MNGGKTCCFHCLFLSDIGVVPFSSRVTQMVFKGSQDRIFDLVVMITARAGAKILLVYSALVAMIVNLTDAHELSKYKLSPYCVFFSHIKVELSSNKNVVGAHLQYGGPSIQFLQKYIGFLLFILRNEKKAVIEKNIHLCECVAAA